MRTDLTHLISGIAHSIHRRYRQYAEAEDLRQEMWVWAYAQPKMKLDSLSTGTLRRRLWDVGLDYARREKAVKSGYDPDDEKFYSITVIRELLPWVVDPEPPILRGVDDRQTSNARRSAAGPAMELETVVVDLRKAYNRLSLRDRMILQTQVEFGMSEASDVDAALRKMQRALGGRKPKREAA
jgi:DNA-directed RNA polymerase specialized sigma24 family protein